MSAIGAQRAVGRIDAAPTLVVDASLEIDSTDPQHGVDHTSETIDRGIYDTLFTYRGSDLGHPVPLLVRSWTMSADARTFTFRLKRNARFADRTPLTATDVVFSLRRLINLKATPSFYLDGVASVSAPSKYTVAIRTSTPEPQLPAILTVPSTGIVNSKLVRAHGGTDAPDASTADTAEQWLNSSASAGAGSGPYELQTYLPTSQVTLEANPHYWGTTKPAFGKVVFRNMLGSAQLLNIQRGSHEIALDLSPSEADTLSRNKRLNVKRQPSAWLIYMFTNFDTQVSTVTSNQQFQQALRYAVDYKSLVSVAGRGAIQAPGVIPSMILGALPQRDALKRDLVKAKAKLAASGVGNQQVTLEYPSDLAIDGVQISTLAQKLQAGLAQAGFNVALAGEAASTYIPKLRAGKVALGIWQAPADYLDPADFLLFTPGNIIANHYGWPQGSDPAIEKLVAKAVLATAPAARKVLYQQIQLGLNARGPVIPLIQPTQILASTSDLAGVALANLLQVDVTQVSPRR